MTRCNDCIRMLQLLKTRGKLSRSQLAAELECTKRQVQDYYQELLKSGYDIESQLGRNGGYVLHSKTILPSSGFTPLEVQALDEARGFMTSHPEFLLQKPYLSAMDKLLSSLSMSKEDTGFYFQNENNLSLAMREAVKISDYAKKEHICISFDYRSMSSNSWRNVVIQPYEILFYKDSYYCLGYVLHTKDYRIYKYSDERMKNCVLTTYTFTRDRDFRLEQHIGKNSIFHGELITLELEIYGNSARLVCEQQFGFNTSKEWISEDVLYVRTIMEGKIAAISFLLSLQSECKLISPHFLKLDMAKIAKDLSKVYADNDAS